MASRAAWWNVISLADMGGPFEAGNISHAIRPSSTR
jgi:hypothetical protein